MENINTGFEFYNTTMPDTRPARYHLGCLEGSVFMDFDDDENHRVCLKRISFDGYGCCDLKNRAKPMDEIDSIKFRKIIATEPFNQSGIETIIRKAILMNREFIWEDALKEYSLY